LLLLLLLLPLSWRLFGYAASFVSHTHSKQLDTASPSSKNAATLELNPIKDLIVHNSLMGLSFFLIRPVKKQVLLLLLLYIYIFFLATKTFVMMTTTATLMV